MKLPTAKQTDRRASWLTAEQFAPKMETLDF